MNLYAFVSLYKSLNILKEQLEFIYEHEIFLFKKRVHNNNYVSQLKYPLFEHLVQCILCTKSTILLFSKHFNQQSGGRLADIKQEIKTETTRSLFCGNYRFFCVYFFGAKKSNGRAKFFG